MSRVRNFVETYKSFESGIIIDLQVVQTRRFEKVRFIYLQIVPESTQACRLNHYSDLPISTSLPAGAGDSHRLPHSFTTAKTKLTYVAFFELMLAHHQLWSNVSFAQSVYAFQNQKEYPCFPRHWTANARSSHHACYWRNAVACGMKMCMTKDVGSKAYKEYQLLTH